MELQPPVYQLPGYESVPPSLPSLSVENRHIWLPLRLSSPKLRNFVSDLRTFSPTRSAEASNFHHSARCLGEETVLRWHLRGQTRVDRPAVRALRQQSNPDNRLGSKYTSRMGPRVPSKFLVEKVPSHVLPTKKYAEAGYRDHHRGDPCRTVGCRCPTESRRCYGRSTFASRHLGQSAGVPHCSPAVFNTFAIIHGTLVALSRL